MDTASLRIAINTNDVKSANAELDKLSKTSGNTEKATAGVTKSFSALNAVLTVGAVSAVAAQYIKLADTMTGIQSKLKLVTSSTQELATAQNELFKIAQKTRQGFAETVDTYSNFALAMGDMGKSQKEILRVTETVNKAIAISGGTAQQAAAATMQLGQAFASGTLRGDELNSILENSKGLAQAIAEGMGVPIGKLRTLGSEGKITAEILATALERSAQSVDDKFSKVGVTVGMSVTQMENSLLQLVGEADKAMNGSGGLSDTFSYFAKSMDDNRSEIIESGKDAYRALQVMGVGMVQFGTSFYQAGVAIPTAIALAIDTVTQLTENGINDMIGLAEEGANKVKSLYGGERVKLGRVDIDTNISKGLLSHYNAIVDAQENAITTQGKLFKDIIDDTTELKKIAPPSDKGSGRKSGARELTKEEIAAAKKAAKEAEKLRLEEAKIQKGYLDSYAELEAQAAIEQYEMEIGHIEDLAKRQSDSAISLYEMTLSDTDKLNAKFMEINETSARFFDQETLVEFYTKWQEEIEKIGLSDSKDFEVKIRATGFDEISNAIAGITNSFADLMDANDQYEENKKKYAKNAEALAKNEFQYQQNQINGYANMAGALIGFTKKGSAAQKALANTQKGIQLYQMAMQIKEIALQNTYIASLFTKEAAVVATGAVEVATNTAVTASSVPAAIAGASIGIGPVGLATGAAMVAFLASQGLFSGAKSSTVSDSFSSMTANTGTGSVLGDTAAQSESIAKSIEIMGDLAKPEFRIMSEMAKSLDSIDQKIGGVSGLLLRQGGFAMGTGYEGFDSGMANNISLSKGVGAVLSPIAMADQILSKIPILNMFSGITSGILNSALGGLFGKSSVSQTMTDSGIYFADALLKNAVDTFEGSAYQTISTTVSKKSWFSKSSSTSIATYFAGLDSEVERQFSLVLSNLYDTAILAGSALDTASSTIDADLSDFVVSIGKISLLGKTGDQIQETLSAIFGKIADDIALDVFPLLIPFQKIGEGLFETMTRVAGGMEEAEYYINRLGLAFNDVVYSDLINKQGDVALEALRQSILDLEGTSGGVSDIIQNLSGNVSDLYDTYSALDRLRFSLTAIGTTSDGLTSSMLYGAGGIQALDDATQTYIENYLTESEKVAYNTAVMTDAFNDLGLTIPTSKQGFTDLLKGIDVTTESGQDLYGRLILLSEGFNELTDSSDKIKSSLFDNIQKFIDSISGKGTMDAPKAFSDFSASFNTMVDAIANGSSNLLDVGNIALDNAQNYLNTVTATATAGRDVDFAKAMLVNKFSGVIATPDTTLNTINDTLRFSLGESGAIATQLQDLKAQVKYLNDLNTTNTATNLKILSTQRSILGETATA